METSIEKINILQRLNMYYASSEVTRLANTGDWKAARECAASRGMWGTWEDMGKAIGLPCDADAKKQWIIAWKARRAAKGKAL